MTPEIKLAENWKAILTRAWSVRFITIAGVLSGAEVIMQSLSDAYPDGSFAVASAIMSTLALVARLIAQAGVEE